ncbi:DNA polymerase iota, putative [Talaromyces stipitatus ATCC 10500]|uniref:DNA polymerase iota, putative n=1 Tax=Talaromyces stipitatus (strain ATCC 10500 / CBS 375.48 / QM 6759 / NRRL 1006) TaxID=441959 RepID=B8LWN1_TALSN|nr:DNA polymerase iota, putative [Talaromyces stipitatus ATCC 10500]EED24428.1 DNA polymerase iota, putative [Talaromyces stipitatus ATCC 10500]
MAALRRDDNRVIIHFDYDCFYASVLEAENPALKSLPLAVQQKQIIVTCNYEARRRGLRKLQLIKEAKQICPDVVIILGEDLTKFRDVSKSLYCFLKSFLWTQKAERLGFDEVFLDVTEMIDYNMSLLNRHDLAHSFFCLDKRDPAIGFQFDATSYCGLTYPETIGSPLPRNTAVDGQHNLVQRLILGSHLAHYMRSRLDNEHGYTATVGISTSKLLAKLVGNVNKPNNQTTLVPPYSNSEGMSNVNRFIDDHEIGKIPGIGFKSARKIRTYILHREATFEPYTERNVDDQVKVREVRLTPTMGPPKLLDILGGHGASRDIGFQIWNLLNGVDNSEVLEARIVPTQISIEDSYKGLEQFEDVKKQLNLLAASLIKRVRTDLLDEQDHDTKGNDTPRWTALPRTLRLSTRRRSPKNADGSRDYSYANGRTSRSGPVPKFMFSLAESAEAVAEKLVDDSLVSMFRKLHPDKSFGELSLINVAVTNMVETAGDDKQSSGRDIGKMFKQQGSSIASAVVETNRLDDQVYQDSTSRNAANVTVTTQIDNTEWEESDEEDVPSAQLCDVCGSHIPVFAFGAHALYHAVPD